MDVFLQRIMESKKNILLTLAVMIIMGVIFGFLAYQYTNQSVQEFMHKLFYLSDEKYVNDYQLYLYQNIFYIILCTYLSTSYLGCFGIWFLSFLKGIQIAFSLFYACSIVHIEMLTLVLIIMELLIELLLVVLICSMTLYLSFYVSLVSYFIEQNLHFKNILNYRLNTLILSLLILSISLALRLYLIPLF